MTKARKQANFRRRVAIMFFVFFAINLSLKLFGVSTIVVDNTQASPLGLSIVYYGIPAFFLLMGIWFVLLCRAKYAEAESIEIGGCSW